MNNKDILQNQIDQFYSVIAQEKEYRVKVRNWSITIWLAYLAVLGTGKYEIDIFPSIIFLIVVVLIFWVIEGFHQSMVLVNEIRVRNLEYLMARKDIPEELPIDMFYCSGYSTIKNHVKIKMLLRACFTSEPIVFFHTAMVIGSIILPLFFWYYAV